MENKRKITVVFEFDWEDCEDIDDQLMLEDSGLFDNLKNGITYTIITQPKPDDNG